MNNLIPKYVSDTIKALENKGFEAFIVGGCVRDILLSKTPKDWDITTVARPDDVLSVFPNAKYENDFGTVILPIRDKNDDVLDVLEITTYRSETGYSNRRHPDEVKFEDSLEADLSRRDFTINAIAIKDANSKLAIDRDLENHVSEKDGYLFVDLYGGQKDLKKKIIRTVGEPIERFKEDALRIMRTIRFFTQLNFEIEEKTQRSIKKIAGSLCYVSSERIRDEFIKILSSEKAYEGVMLLHDLKLLQYIIPELEKGVGVQQNHHHTYTVFKHSLMSLKYCPSSDWRVRFASLVHDIAKPQTKKIINGGATFYNHDFVGAKMVAKIVKRLKFSQVDAGKIVNLVKNHMFYYNVNEVTPASVRRLIKKVGEENMRDLIDLRIADRLGSGVPKGKPYKLRHLEYIIETVKNDPISVKMLKINGDILIKLLKIKPSPKIGSILDVLLSEVIEDPRLNTDEYLEKRAVELNKLDLDDLRNKAKDKIEDKKTEDDEALKKEFWVK